MLKMRYSQLRIFNNKFNKRCRVSGCENEWVVWGEMCFVYNYHSIIQLCLFIKIYYLLSFLYWNCVFEMCAVFSKKMRLSFIVFSTQAEVVLKLTAHR